MNKYCSAICQPLVHLAYMTLNLAVCKGTALVTVYQACPVNCPRVSSPDRICLYLSILLSMDTHYTTGEKFYFLNIKCQMKLSQI